MKSCAVKDEAVPLLTPGLLPPCWDRVLLQALLTQQHCLGWRGISFSASSCPAVKHRTAPPGAGQQEAEITRHTDPSRMFCCLADLNDSAKGTQAWTPGLQLVCPVRKTLLAACL